MINLGVGNINLSSIALPEGIDNSSSIYGDFQGNNLLISKIMEMESLEYENILITQGASMGLSISFGFLKKKGISNIYIPFPYYPAYKELAILFGFNIIYYDIKKILSLESIESVLSTDYSDSAIILNVPHNPTGLTIDKDHLSSLLSFFDSKKMYTVLDYAYSKFYYNEDKEMDVIDVIRFPKTILIKSFSKTYRLAGERIGVTFSNDQIIPELLRINRTFAFTTSNFSQYMAYACLEEITEGAIQKMIATLKKSKETACALLDKYKLKYYKPSGGIFLWVELPSKFNQNTFYKQLFEKHQILVSPGKSFGSNKHLRISFAYEKEEINKYYPLICDFFINEVGV